MNESRVSVFQRSKPPQAIPAITPGTFYALTIRLPDSIHRTIKQLAKREGCSVNQFLASAAAEKMSALLTLDCLRAEAAGAKREDFEAFLAAVPDVEPGETDRMP